MYFRKMKAFFKDFKNADAIRTDMITKGQQLNTNMTDYKSKKTKAIQKVSPTEFTSVFLWFHVVRSLVFCAVLF